MNLKAVRNSLNYAKDPWYTYLPVLNNAGEVGELEGFLLLIITNIIPKAFLDELDLIWREPLDVLRKVRDQKPTEDGDATSDSPLNDKDPSPRKLSVFSVHVVDCTCN